MRITSAASDLAIANGEVMLHGAVRIAVPTSVAAAGRVCWWGGFGTLNLNAGFGSEAYQGIDRAGLVSVTGGQLGGAAQATVLELSGVDSDVLSGVDFRGLVRAPVVIWRLEFDGAGANLLDARVHKRGRIATAQRLEVVGGEAVIRVEVEGAASGLGRQTGRIRSDADQRLIRSSDPGMREVGFAATKTLNFGGKPPARAGAAIANTGGSGSGGYGDGWGASVIGRYMDVIG